MKMLQRLAVLMAILGTTGTAVASDATYEIRFEAYPFYEARDTDLAHKYKAEPGMRFHFETDADSNTYTVSFDGTSGKSAKEGIKFSAYG